MPQGHLTIKTHDSESRGQEEAGRTQRTSDSIFTSAIIHINDNDHVTSRYIVTTKHTVMTLQSTIYNRSVSRITDINFYIHQITDN